MIYFIDIETNLAHDELWCVAITDEYGETALFTEGQYDSMPEIGANIFVAHYGIAFDFPLLKKFIDYDIPAAQQVDTFIMSKVLEPNREGGHSLRNLARFVGKELKDDFEAAKFDEGFTVDMGNYCKQDTIALASVYAYLTRIVGEEGFTGDWLALEQETKRLTEEQMRNGFMLDVDTCNGLYVELSSKTAAITADLQEAFPPIIHKRVSEKTGKALKDNVETFNPGSRQQIARRLEGLGVRWSKHTEKGNIIVDEQTLGEHVAIPEAAQLLEFFKLNKRQSQVSSWLEKVQEDGRVYGRVDTLGAVTGRMTHSSPNMAQIDSAPETRAVWTVPAGHRLVGVDASGLELRMLAHYMNDPEYIEAVESGDVHALNRDALGLSGSDGRNTAKTFIYAFLYGAGDAKLGSVIGGGAKAGANLKAEFLSNTPALATLREKIARIAAQGHLPALDGRRLRVRHAHAALNTLLQGAGAIVMKRALVIGSEMLVGTDYKLVAQVHDELQMECPTANADEVGNAFVTGIREAGKHYNMRIGLDGEAKIGHNWSSTH
jgi:DNA polymerase I-like protein with 3'-5' exonuclease and polymerase domains